MISHTRFLHFYITAHRPTSKEAGKVQKTPGFPSRTKNTPWLTQLVLGKSHPDLALSSHLERKTEWRL